MSDPSRGFDSTSKIAHIHGGPRDSGNPPGGDQLEARVRRLEDDVKDIKADLKAVRLDVAEMKGRLNAMPTTWQLTGLIIAIMALSFAIIRFGLA